VFSFFRPAPAVAPLPPGQVDAEYRALRWQVFVGIFVGYAGFYLVRNNFSLALPEILKAHPEYTKAQLGGGMTALLTAYGLSKFLMGSVSDRSNPRWFMATGLLLSAAITFAFGVVPAIYGSLTAIIVLQALNGWCNGMGWPPSGKTMVHWWSTRERGKIVSVWNCAHNVGGALVSFFGVQAMAAFGDWGAKFWFNALCRPSSNSSATTRPATRRNTSARSRFGRSFSATCSPTASSGASRLRTRLFISCATAW
jgi:MFS transporter, OPA family, glycerol-3-phosphate transporter